MFNNIKYKFSIVVLIISLLLLTSCGTKNLTETKSSDTPSSSSASEFYGSKNSSVQNGNTESRKFGAEVSSNSTSPENTANSNSGTHEVEHSNNSNYTNTQSSNYDASNNTYNADTNDVSNQNTDYEDKTENSNSSNYSIDTSNDGEFTEFDDTSNSDIEVQNNICSFVIDCSSAINSDRLSSSLRDLLPSNGIIYSNQNLEFSEGETVFDILSRITRQNGIPMEFSFSLTYSSKYVEGINSLYEFDCGENSGWMYKVNGKFPNYGCDKYKINPGNDIVFCYTTENGEYLK